MPDLGVPVRERGRLFLEGALPLQGRRLLLRGEKVSDRLSLPPPPSGRCVSSKKVIDNPSRQKKTPRKFGAIKRELGSCRQNHMVHGV